jgi:hypothetical protein
MRKTKLLLAATAALTLSAGAASAAWLPIIERQAVMNDRIDAALQAGDLSSAQARNLRADMASLVALEGRYRWGGLSAWEKVDLDRRYAALDDQLRISVASADSTAFDAAASVGSIEDRKLALDARIDRGLRDGALTQAEADRLRDDFDDIARVEANYRVDGLSPDERADLNRRFSELSERIRLAEVDHDRAYSWNRY